MVDDMVDTMFDGDVNGIIGTAVIDNEDENFINTGQLAREVGQCFGQGIGFIETGNLDNEFHRVDCSVGWEMGQRGACFFNLSY